MPLKILYALNPSPCSNVFYINTHYPSWHTILTCCKIVYTTQSLNITHSLWCNTASYIPHNFLQTTDSSPSSPTRSLYAVHFATYHTILYMPHSPLHTTQSSTYHTIQYMPHNSSMPHNPLHTTQSSTYHTILWIPNNSLHTTQSSTYHTSSKYHTIPPIHTILYIPHNPLHTTQSSTYHTIPPIHTILYIPHNPLHTTQSSTYDTILWIPYNPLHTTQSLQSAQYIHTILYIPDNPPYHTILYIPHNPSMPQYPLVSLSCPSCLGSALCVNSNMTRHIPNMTCLLTCITGRKKKGGGGRRGPSSNKADTRGIYQRTKNLSCNLTSYYFINFKISSIALDNARKKTNISNHFLGNKIVMSKMVSQTRRLAFCWHMVLWTERCW